MNEIEKRARELLVAEFERDGLVCHAQHIRNGEMVYLDDGRALRAIIAALTPPEHSDQSLMDLASTVETCIPFLPPAGQRNIGKAVAQLRHMAMGYVLVPVVLTQEMEDAGYPADTAQEGWAAMLAARPEVKP